MNADKIIDLLTTEIITELRLPRDLYSKFIRERIEWAYVAGEEQGRLSHGSRKEVIQLTLEGKFIKSWEGPYQAGRILGIHPSAIAKCACKQKHHNTSGGFKWEYGKDYYPKVMEESFAHITEEMINQYNYDNGS